MFGNRRLCGGIYIVCLTCWFLTEFGAGNGNGVGVVHLVETDPGVVATGVGIWGLSKVRRSNSKRIYKMFLQVDVYPRLLNTYAPSIYINL